MVIKGWNVFEICWIVLFSLISIILSLVWGDTLFGLSVFFSGVICVVLAAKGNIWTYGFGIYNSLAYAILSYSNGLYGETMLNALYYFPMQIIGWFLWKNRVHGSTVIMRKLNSKGLLVVTMTCLLGTSVYGLWLSTLAGQNTPFIDAFTTILSVVAMILMAQRYREQWGLFIMINIVSVLMWSYRLASGSQDASTMVVMWTAYLVNSVYGFYHWSKGACDTVTPTEEKIDQMNRGINV